MLEWVKNNKRVLLIALAFIVVVLFCWWLWHRAEDAEGRAQKAVTLSEAQAKNTAILEDKLNISQTNAKALQEAYEKEKNKPVTTFYVQAPTVAAGAQQVQEKINNKDPSLPAAALEKTDRTAVVANETQQKVDVLKINLDKSWELSAGVGVHRGDAYIPVGIQFNVGKSVAWELEAHLSPVRGEGESLVSGGEVKRVWRFK